MGVLTQETIAKIEEWEGVVLYAYDDATGKAVKPGDKVHGTLTIGVGHVGPDVKPGLTITRAQVDVLLQRDLQTAVNAVTSLVKVPLNDHQFGTLVSFAFNAGVGALRSSTLLKKLNAGQYAAVPAELMKWTKTHIGGKLVNSPGLVKRRSNEAAYWSAGGATPSMSTRIDPSPAPAAMEAQQGAVPVKDAPSWVTPEAITTATGAVSAAGAVASGNGPVQYALAAVLVIAVAIGIYFFVIKRMRPV